MLKLSEDQKTVLTSLLDWFNAKNKPPFVTFGGYAGTGKTTLISVLRKKLKKKNKNLKVSFCSYTGKAARVLESTLKQQKAIYEKDTVGTIHSLIYSPIIDEKTEEIIGWEKKDDLKSDLIIVDEASMVDETIWRDLLTYNIPIIAVGDHGQLPPIRGKFNLMEDPELKLEKIHRQAQDNPIIKVSILARERGFIPTRKYSVNVMKVSRQDEDSQELVADLLASFDEQTLILCGYNKTRIMLNTSIRQIKEFESPLPSPKDRVICLRNNHQKRIYNGMLGYVNSIEKDDKNWYYAKIDLDDEEKQFKGLISVQQFNNPQPFNFTKDRGSFIMGDLFDFGYALTVHKAQGSQSKRVILFEERFPRMDDEMWRRWLYTGVTRAQEELYIVGN
jgi:ATP-dependent exoDNAse (exonuclease V) alpha subunit